MNNKFNFGDRVVKFIDEIEKILKRLPLLIGTIITIWMLIRLACSSMS